MNPRLVEAEQSLKADGWPAVLTKRELVKRTGWSERTVERYVAAGKLHALQADGVRPYFLRVSVARFFTGMID